MPSAHLRAVTFLLLLSGFSARAEVVFSRRVYKEHSKSYQQIWTWNPAIGTLRALTNSPRDHYRPNCEGRTIRFTSFSPDQHPNLWSLKLASGAETAIGPRPEPTERPAPQTRGCARFAKEGDLEACANEETVVISRPGKQIGRFQIQVNTCPVDGGHAIGKCETPIRSLDWTEDSKWLLIGEEGLNDGSGRRQDDYYLADIATMKLRTVASAEIAFWLPGRDQIVYVTPLDLAPLPGSARKHSVWVQ